MKKLSRIHQRVNDRVFMKQPQPRSVFAQPAAVIDSKVRDAVTASDSPIKHVIFMGRDIVKGHRFNPSDVLISISDTGTEPPHLFHKPADMLALAFHDHVTPIEHEKFGWNWMQVEDGKKIVDFVLKHTDAQNIIVHCNYGQSRSKAAAFAIKQMTGREILYANSFGRITQYKAADDYNYNRRVYELILTEYEERPEEAVA